jgi:translation initiation factor IF-2
MEQVTVKELATEFELRSSIVVAELKKIGVWVPSAATIVDPDIANRIRKRLQVMVEAEQEEKEKKAEKPHPVSGVRARRSIKELGKPRKRAVRKKAVPEGDGESLPPSPLSGSLKPRKGRKAAAYRKVEEVVEVETPQKIEISIEDEPLIEKVVAEAPVEAIDETAVLPEETSEVEAPSEEKDVAAAATEEVVVEEPAEVEEPTVETVEVEEAVAEVETAADEAPEPEAAAVLEVKVKTVQPVKKKSAAEKKRKKKRARAEIAAKVGEQVPEGAAVPGEITFSEKVTAKVFSEKSGVRSGEVIKALMELGIMASMNQVLDEETIMTLCEKFGLTPNFVTFEEAAAIQDQPPESPEDLAVRAPVVTVMGHVDHGKTTLLDHMRHTRVAAGEAGGITQHIGAYEVFVKGQKLVFIDTPGHEAFTLMRARGAQATDIVVLVVAADDGVMPQTLEAIDHAKAAGVPIVVAINKIDKPGCQPDRVKQELGDRGLLAEDWGGDTIMVQVSATEGTGVDTLLEMLLLVSEMQELKANPKRAASGVVLEAKMEKGRGAVATLLIQNGTLQVGEIFIAGNAYGKVRAMFNDRGKPSKKVGPSSAVEILGLQGIPLAGDAFQVVEDQAQAREMVQFRQDKEREMALTKTVKTSLDELYKQMEAGIAKELPVVLKADTQGSVEVLDDTLQKLSTDKVKVDVILKNVGAITESDVILASASNAIVIGFNVRPEPSAKSVAEHEGVEIRLYTVIYDIADEIQQAMLGLLEPTIKEVHMGRAEVRETFRVPKVGTVAGSYVQEGSISRSSELRLLRDNVVVYVGKLGSLRRFKEDVSEVKSGYECGISIQNFNDVKIGDVIEAFVKEEVAPQLN